MSFKGSDGPNRVALSVLLATQDRMRADIVNLDAEIFGLQKRIARHELEKQNVSAHMEQLADSITALGGSPTDQVTSFGYDVSDGIFSNPDPKPFNLEGGEPDPEPECPKGWAAHDNDPDGYGLASDQR